MTLFIHIAEIVIAAAIAAALLKKLKQPSLFAYIIAGIIIGPLVLGSISLAQWEIPYSAGISEITPEIMLLSELGAAFLMFSIGTETSVKKLFQIGKPILFGTILQVLIIIALAFVLTVPFGLLNLEAALFVGTIIAFSSTMIVVKLLSDKNQANTLEGRIMISILLLQDFLVIFFVPLLANISSSLDLSLIGLVLGKSLLLIAIAFILNKVVFPKLFKVASEEHEMFFIASVAIAFFFIGLSYVLDIPAPIGAFIGGLALSTLPYNLEIFAKIRALRDFFLTIFFVSLGAQLSFSFGNIPLALMLVIGGLIFVAKPAVLFFMTLFAGYGSKIGVKVGISLAQVSEFGFVLAAIGVTTIGFNKSAVITPELFSFLITMIALSMIITPYLTTSSSRVANFFYEKAEKLPRGIRKEFFRRKIDELGSIPSKKALKNHIIIVGGGTVGRGLTKALQKANQIIIVDHDPEVVRQGLKDNLPYVYGSAENEMIWDRLDLKDAKLMVITIPNHKEAEKIVSQTKILAPKLTIFASSHYFNETLDFYKKGVDFVAMTTIMGLNVFLENISTFLDSGKLHHVQNFKTEYITYLERQVEEEKKYRK